MACAFCSSAKTLGWKTYWNKRLYVFAALTEFVTDVQDQAGSGSDGAGASTPSHALRNLAIGVSVLVALGVLGFFLIARPVRRRR